LGLRVRVGLGSLGPDDVEVQAVSGRVDEEDRITDATAVPLKPAGAPDSDGRWGPGLRRFRRAAVGPPTRFPARIVRKAPMDSRHSTGESSGVE
ncbi:hypothetical protein ACFC0M_38825, partial [Streptomyces sp. NPDC056149]|uniref:hypothetical protein n=1 Tax=Streptomyces sp. NPDC056149 TaxID=3345728 RepID=UPI0035DDD2B5